MTDARGSEVVPVLVTRPYGLGNVVQAIPALRLLLGAGVVPVVAVGNKTAEDVMRNVWHPQGNMPTVRDCSTVACKDWISLWPWDGAMRPGRFERRHGYTEDDRAALAERYGADAIWSQNEALLNAQIVADFLGLKPGWELPPALLWPQGGPVAYEVDKRLVGIHPGCQGGAGSVWGRKRWPVERWLALVSLLIKGGRRVRVFGTSLEDRDVLAAILREYDGEMGEDSPIDFFIDSPVDRAAWAAGVCGAFVSNDSGMAHLAVAGGCKRVVVLYGPTRPEKNTHGPMVPVVAYGACAFQPCYSDHFSDDGLVCSTKACMTRISVERVLKELAI